MAHFDNEQILLLESQCNICEYGETDCPVRQVQDKLNGLAKFYNAINTAMDLLINGKGQCQVFEMAKDQFSKLPIEYEYEGETT